MNVNCYPFTVGRFECTVLLDGAWVVGEEGMQRRYPDVPAAAQRQAMADIGLSLETADNAMNILAARIGDELVLIDTGEGGGPNRGHLPESMKLAGIAPEAITRVVLTHSHGDHVLGLLTDAGEPAFPNATYVISEPEMQFWRTQLEGSAANQQAIVAMMESHGLRCIAMNEAILPGLTAMPIPGHTPGQIALIIESDGERLIHLADLLHGAMQFAHPEWSARYDADTRVSVPTRRAALQRAADEAMLALFYHLTFPGLGRVRSAGQAFTWEPVKP